MTSTLITVILIVAPVGSSDPSPDAVARALRQALGPETTVSVERRPSLPADTEALSLRPSAAGAAVAEVIFRDDEHKSALVRVYLEPRRTWVDHAITFDPADAVTERERTIGFTIASMLPEAREALPEAKPLPPTTRPVAPTEEHDVGAFDAAVTAAQALGGYGGGIGASLGTSLDLSPILSVGLRLGARLGEVAPANATSTLFEGGLGLRLGRYGSERSRLVWAGRIDLLATRYELIHLSPDDDAPRHQARWLPAAALTFEAGWALTHAASVVARGGGEALLGETHVFTHGREVATISPWQALAAVGVIVRY
jgi:hypothetical protein